MKEHPIIFNGDMVRAILSGRKTQTRRPITEEVVKELAGHTNYYPELIGSGGWWMLFRDDQESATVDFKCPYGEPGDRLWVRETWKANANMAGVRITHRAGGEEIQIDEKDFPDAPIGLADDDHWRPSIHMPRWASRITLEVTGVRVERVQEIIWGDPKAEGFDDVFEHQETCDNDNCSLAGGLEDCDGVFISPRVQFMYAWDSIYGKRGLGWDANPWVWAVEFKRL